MREVGFPVVPFSSLNPSSSAPSSVTPEEPPRQIQALLKADLDAVMFVQHLRMILHEEHEHVESPLFPRGNHYRPDVRHCRLCIAALPLKAHTETGVRI